jgi:hypothetical protein
MTSRPVSSLCRWAALGSEESWDIILALLHFTINLLTKLQAPNGRLRVIAPSPHPEEIRASRSPLPPSPHTMCGASER